MPISFKQFVAELESRGNTPLAVPSCAVCDIPLQETVTGCRKTENGFVCSDCYFEAFGKELDEHPLFMPRAVHGTA